MANKVQCDRCGISAFTSPSGITPTGWKNVDVFFNVKPKEKRDLCPNCIEEYENVLTKFMKPCIDLPQNNND